MSYTPTNWQCGDTISAEKLNKIEQGIAECCSGGGTLVVNRTVRTATAEECANGGSVYVLDRTWQEIHDAVSQGVLLLIYSSTSYGVQVSIYSVRVESDQSAYYIGYSNTPDLGSWEYFSTDNANSYPFTIVCESPED